MRDRTDGAIIGLYQALAQSANEKNSCTFFSLRPHGYFLNDVNGTANVKFSRLLLASHWTF
jgi:hypothetical protein